MFCVICIPIFDRYTILNTFLYFQRNDYFPFFTFAEKTFSLRLHDITDI